MRSSDTELEVAGKSMYGLISKLYPICRSITGEGVRKTLTIMSEQIPLDIHEISTGTKVFDWEIPLEWNIRDAWVKDESGTKIIDFDKHNLHVLNYSVPFYGLMNLEELNNHLYSLPDNPDVIPYRTSYFQANWGFCLAHNQRIKMPAGTYEVCIDSSLTEGSLTYGECFIKGESDEEILFSAHICHPSLANDNLSGIAVLVELIKVVRQKPRRYSYRFIFAPGTIGAITWLAQNESILSLIKGGLVASLLGDDGIFNYKRSRRGNAEIDRIVEAVLELSSEPYEAINFEPYGYDERQYCSPGIDLPMGCLTRSTYGSFPEYHTSNDDLDFITEKSLQGSLEIYSRIVEVIESNTCYVNLFPKGEPQLGRRGLYEAIGGRSDQKIMQTAMLWVLNLSDGSNDLLEISRRSGMDFDIIAGAALILRDRKLLGS